jgi:glycosyltransferase involved in cell wall biosynthesis
MIVPKISVIMPVYNASKYLSEAIQSILNQTFEDFELIILNDNSTDDSLDIIKKIQLLDPRIVLINKEKNYGPAILRNEGFNISRGEYIALMDADDISLPTRFEKQIELLKNNPQIDLCGTWYTKFGEHIKDEMIKHYEFDNDLKVYFLRGCYIANPTVLMRKKIITDYRYDSTYFPMDDYELLTRLIAKFTFYNIQESLLRYRWHATNISKSKEVNLEQIQNKIRLKQLQVLEIDTENSTAKYYLDVISYAKKRKPNEVIEILKCRENLIKKNTILKKYDPLVFENFLNDNVKKTILKASFYNIILFKFLLKNKYIKSYNLLDKSKIIFKSIFNWQK